MGQLKKLMENDMANQLPVDSEQVDVSAEEAHNQEMIDLVEDKEITPPGMEPQDKFGGDYEKLMQSYQELEKKLGQPKAPEVEAAESGNAKTHDIEYSLRCSLISEGPLCRPYCPVI